MQVKLYLYSTFQDIQSQSASQKSTMHNKINKYYVFGVLAFTASLLFPKTEQHLQDFIPGALPWDWHYEYTSL